MLTFRPYREGDERQLVDLFHEVFGEQRTLEDFHWKYTGSPDGFEISVAEDKARGTIVGFYGGSYFRVKFGDRSGYAGHTFDTCVHADYRKRNVFIRLYQVFIDQVLRKEYAIFGYGMNDPASVVFKVGNKLLQYHQVTEVPRLVARLSLRGVAGRTTRNPLLLGAAAWLGNAWYRSVRRMRRRRAVPLAVRAIESFGPWATRLWAEVAPRYPIAVVRDETYQRWRYARPGRRYTILGAYNPAGGIAGYITLGQGREHNLRAGYLLDLVAGADPRVAEALVGAALDWGLSEGVDFLECWNVGDQALFRVLREAGFRQRPWRGRLALLYRRLQGEDEEGSYRDFRNWHITMSDSDVY